jgi:hypothetical protein
MIGGWDLLHVHISGYDFLIMWEDIWIQALGIGKGRRSPKCIERAWDTRIPEIG